jgi:hypothetical protein
VLLTQSGTWLQDEPETMLPVKPSAKALGKRKINATTQDAERELIHPLYLL